MASPQKFVELSPPPSMIDKFMPRQWSTWFTHIFDRLGAGPFAIQGYDKASLISPYKIDPKDWGSLVSQKSFSSLVFVRDESGGQPCLAYSDGTDWRRVHDNAIMV